MLPISWLTIRRAAPAPGAQTAPNQRRPLALSAVVGSLGIAAALLCGTPDPARADSDAQNASVAQSQSGQPAQQKTDSQAADKGKTDKDAKTKDQPKDQPKADAAQTPPWLSLATTLIDKVLSWMLVALIFIFMFRDRLDALMDGVISALGDRAVTFEVAQVKIQVSERTQDLSEDRGSRFSVSPMDLDPESYESVADTLDILPQDSFQVSDDAARWWYEHRAQGAADDLGVANQKFTALQNKIGKAVRLDDVKQELIDFSRALEAVRFIDAPRLKDLLEASTVIRDAIAAQAKAASLDAEGKMIVHAAGVAYLRVGMWSMARALLEPIAWANGQPAYLPAADAWLAALYRDAVEQARSPDTKAAPGAFIKAVLEAADNVVAKAQTVRGAMEKPGWSPTAANVPYYRRELYKVLGSIAGVHADYSEENKQQYLKLTLDAYSACVDEVGGEAASPLDHNNLADTYRQCGRFDQSLYAKAHSEVDIALVSSPDDPTFLNTKAMIFIDEKKLDEAATLLTRVAPAKSAKVSSQDIVQYLDNQILAAKVISGTQRPRVVRQSLAADILEAAVRFHQDRGASIEDRLDRDRLAADLHELLGFTYLGLQGYERRSVECYECVGRLFHTVHATAEVRWRRRLGTVRAHTWLARAARRKFDFGTAGDQRRRGRKVLNDNLDELGSWCADKGQSSAVARPQARVKLDTAMALQGLAEESFFGGELEYTKQLLDKKDGFLATLINFHDDPAIGDKVRLADALTGLLRGSLAFQSDPGTYLPAVLTDIEKNLLAARGQDPLLDCQADLALGEAFLTAALKGQASDALANYRKAVNAFEFAVGRNAPDLRADATRALVDAYDRRGAVQLRAKQSKPA